MDDVFIYTTEDEVSDVRMMRPHVVILGAGASRAAFPDGDRNGCPLPLMIDFAACVGLTELLESWGVDPAKNFEDTYTDLHEAGEAAKLDHLNTLVEAYFGALELPDAPTIYDYLILSLRETDIIATFNWDPLLLKAFLRSPRTLSKPRLSFLHGNVMAGYCDEDRVLGLAGATCRHCQQPFKRTPLLYPVRHKNYATDPAIADQWKVLQWGLENAFMFTIFGYSGPKTDQEAIKAMSTAWGDIHDRQMEQTAFITLQTDEEVRTAWGSFIHTHHYEVQHDFFESWLARHPRRTGEAYLSQFIDAKFVEDNLPPRSVSLEQLRDWYQKFLPAEHAAG